MRFSIAPYLCDPEDVRLTLREIDDVQLAFVHRLRCSRSFEQNGRKRFAFTWFGGEFGIHSEFTQTRSLLSFLLCYISICGSASFYQTSYRYGRWITLPSPSGWIAILAYFSRSYYDEGIVYNGLMLQNARIVGLSWLEQTNER
ncbi:hypothetical protein D3C75_858630 [compost metagenome]